jgi:hypothetical protein
MDIKNALNTEKGETAAGTAHIESELQAMLLQLKDAINAKNMKDADRLIAEMSAKYAGTADTFNNISDQVLVGEYKAAIETIDHLIG